MIRSKSRTS